MKADSRDDNQGQTGFVPGVWRRGEPLGKNSLKTFLKAVVFSLLAISAAYCQTPSTQTPKASSHRRSKRKHLAKSHGQQKIDAQRAQQIQQALIREHYFSGEATGVWDDASQKAMQSYQAANGWQTKEIPDSRALIKLGLGPDQVHLLNPESAMTMTAPPQLPSSTVEDSTATGQHK